MQRSNVVGFRSRATNNHLGAKALSNILANLRDTSKQRVAHLLRQLFNSADDALFAMADKAGSNGDQTHYFDAMRELRLQKKHIATQVVKGLSASFEDFDKVAPTLRDEISSLDGLDLIDKEEMELKVAVEGMVSRVKASTGTAMEELRCRFEALAKSSESNASASLAIENMPSSPETLCEHFVRGMESLDVSIRARLVILKLFEQHVLTKMSNVYVELNEIFIKHGVLPDLKAHQRANKTPPIHSKQTESQASNTRQAYLQPEEQADQSDDLVPTLNVSFDSSHISSAPSSNMGGVVHDLGNLLQTARQSNNASEPPTLAVAHYTQADIFNTLSNVQSEQFLNVANGGACEVIDFRSILNARLASQSDTTSTFNEIDEDVINLVSMLFEFILDDRQLQPVMKALISRLQIPMLKVALMDRSFFSKGGHPARQLLNLIASSAIGWTEAPEGRKDYLRIEIENVVETILKEFDDNVELFAELLGGFQMFVDKEERRRLLIERRISDSEEGKAANDIAQQKVKSTVDSIIQGRSIPDCVLQIIEDGLSRVLLLSFLKEGEQSADWKKHCRLVEDLVWTVEPTNIDESTRTSLLSMIPKVVSSVRQTLKEISFDEFKLDNLLKSLETEHIKTLGRAHGQSLELSVGETVSPAKEVPQNEDAERAQASETEDESVDLPTEVNTEALPANNENSPFLQQVDQFAVGCWFEFIEGEQVERCKLAAVIKVTGKYIFVNRSGVKVAERTREELASDLRQARVQVLNDGLLFDRALESVITNLRDQS